jgi:hypothetical protein
MPWLRIGVRLLGPPQSEREVALAGTVQSFARDQLLVDESTAAELATLLEGADPEFDLVWDGLRFQRCCVLRRIAGTGTVVEYLHFESDGTPPKRG